MTESAAERLITLYNPSRTQSVTLPTSYLCLSNILYSYVLNRPELQEYTVALEETSMFPYLIEWFQHHRGHEPQPVKKELQGTHEALQEAQQKWLEGWNLEFTNRIFAAREVYKMMAEAYRLDCHSLVEVIAVRIAHKMRSVKGSLQNLFQSFGRSNQIVERGMGQVP